MTRLLDKASAERDSSDVEEGLQEKLLIRDRVQSLIQDDLLTWDQETVQSWLKTSSNGKYAELCKDFVGVDGRDLCFMTENQLVLLAGPGRGISMFNQVKAMKNASKEEKKR